MRRPIPPPRAWQAVLAVAGLLALVSAHARPVDLWRVSVLSHQGQPLHAVATIEARPDERITDACLSLGPETDAPGSDAPFLQSARLTLNAAGTRVEIRGDQPVRSPTLALVLRVQCPGEMLYARHFGLLIPPAPATAPPRVPGFKLKVAQGETVESLARLLLPDNRRLREKMIREVLATNPHAFPDGRPAAVAPGTLLYFPDLRSLRELPERQAAPAARQPRPAPAAAKPRPVAPVPEAGAGDTAPPPQPVAPATAETPETAPPSEIVPREPPATKPPVPQPPLPRTEVPQPAAPQPSPPQTSAPQPAAPQVRLQPALELGANPTPQQCRQAMALCGTPAGGELEQRTLATEQSAAALRLRQDSIEQQLERLERSVQSLQRSLTRPPPAAAPAQPEIRTVVKTEPMPWYYWLGLLGALMAGALGGFVFGRKRAFSDAAVAEDQRLDRMLATAAATIREMETAPVRKPAAAPGAQPAPYRPAPPPVEAPPPESAEEVQSTDEAEAATQPEAGAAVDLELESGPTEKPAGLSSDVLFEMDQALDNTRSMFTDVDRFIALGRTQNAISLLQFQVHKDPKDRDSWIKLMAIYRQEKMDIDLAKAAREFKRNFPDENPPVV